MSTLPSKIFGYAIFLAYPFVFHDYYFDIVTCKYILLIVLSVSLLIAEMIFNSRLTGKRMLTSTDYMVFGMLCLSVISAVMSDYKADIINGVDGRNNGIITIFICGLVYFIFSRDGFNRKGLFYAIAIGSIPVSVLGILHFINIDPLGFYREISSDYRQFYISTLGHVNVYSSYFAITIPIVLINCFNSSRVWEKICFFVVTVINISALLCGMCDSAAMIIGTAVLCTVIYNKMINAHIWLFLATVVLGINKVLVICNGRSREARKLSIVQEILSRNSVIAIVISALIIFIIIEQILIWFSRGGRKSVQLFKWLLVIMACCMVIVLIAGIVYFTCIDKETDLGQWSGILRFGDEFGSYRGYIWRITLSEYSRLPFLKKLIGIGPDALMSFLDDRRGMSLYRVTNAYYDNAHNELLQYLITMGAVWLVLYIGVLAIQIRKGWRRDAVEPIGEDREGVERYKADRIIVCAIICYFVSGLVNINQVVTTPMLVLLVSIMGVDEKKENAMTLYV